MLDDAWDACPEGANTLRQQLRDFEKEPGSLFKGGSIASVSKNSSSQTYSLPGSGRVTAQQMANGWRNLINLFDQCATDLDVSGAGDQDESIYTEMMTRLKQSVTEYFSDYSLAGCAR